LVYAVLIVLLIAAQLISPGFLSLGHMDSVLRQSAFLGIVAIGQMFVILTGGIDISVASVISMANVVAAQVMSGKDANVPLAVGLVLLIGLVAGLANGLGVYYLRISPIVMTLAMGGVFQGAALIYSKGAPKGQTAPFIQYLSTGKIGGSVSVLIVLWIVLAAAVIVVLRRTVYGRSTYIVGTSPRVARYSGIKVGFQTVSVYVISGVMAAITGLLLVGYTNTSYITAGTVYTMNSIAAVVIGGTSIMGGAGGYGGTIAGAVIMTVIVSLLTIVSIPEAGRDIVQGLLIIGLLLIYGRQSAKK